MAPPQKPIVVYGAEGSGNSQKAFLMCRLMGLPLEVRAPPPVNNWSRYSQDPDAGERVAAFLRINPLGQARTEAPPRAASSARDARAPPALCPPGNARPLNAATTAALHAQVPVIIDPNVPGPTPEGLVARTRRRNHRTNHLGYTARVLLRQCARFA